MAKSSESENKYKDTRIISKISRLIDPDILNQQKGQNSNRLFIGDDNVVQWRRYSDDSVMMYVAMCVGYVSAIKLKLLIAMTWKLAQQ